MRIAVAGGHGKIGLRLTALPVARGDTVVGLIRNPDHAADVRAAGAEPVVCDPDDVFSLYLRAKAEADAAVTASDRRWTIVRPGGLTDDTGTGRVRIDTTPFRATIARDDVAAVLAAIIAGAGFDGLVLYVNGGATPIDDALGAALRG
jgi:uncharacterized protein YbjT (DUF2867 family)